MASDQALARIVRGRRIGLIPQSPAAHLTPVRTARAQLEETVRVHHPGETPPRVARELVDALLDELHHLTTEHRAVLLITHDLAAARRVADRVAVMYAGHLVEVEPTADVLEHPRHPYTHGLINSLQAGVHAHSRLTPVAHRTADRMPVPPPLRTRHPRMPAASVARRAHRR